MDGKLIEAQDVFLDRTNEICSKLGLNNMMAQVYAILYLSDKPLSLDDMVERLKISKASASINIRALERYNAVRKVWVRGSRKDYYEAETDIAKVVIDRIKAIGQSRLLEIDGMINSSYDFISSFKPSDTEERKAIKVFNERLNKLRKLHRKAQTLFSLVS